MTRRKRKRKTSKKSNLIPVGSFPLKEETKRYIFGIISFLLTIIFALSFFEKAGVAGKALFEAFDFLLGKAVFLLPLIFTISGLVFFRANYKKVFQPLLLAAIVFLSGICGILDNLEPGVRQGGFLGYILSLPLLSLFGFWVTQVIVFLAVVIGGLIFWQLLKQPVSEGAVSEKPSLAKTKEDGERKPSLVRKIFTPSFKVKRVESFPVVKKEEKITKESSLELKAKPIKYSEREYKMPPIELLA